MKVLSLFDGISCARAALDRAEIPVDVYYASEIDESAKKISHKNYPDIIQVGDVTTLHERFDLTPGFGGGIDLLIGGSPCQDLSFAGKRVGLVGERSGLFYKYVEVMEKIKPKYFILENVASMHKTQKDIISSVLGVEPVKIDASLVSAQTRRRYFWTNIHGVQQPSNLGLFLGDIIEAECAGPDLRPAMERATGKLAIKKQSANQRTLSEKMRCLTASGQSRANSGATLVRFDSGFIRNVTPLEAERGQGLPDGYTDGLGLSKTARHKAIGNAFNVDVVAHILRFIPKQ
jgi:DNA (cytosine-5)-methyltransferase 3A